MKYGERLKLARKRIPGLTQKKLSDMIGNACTQENISKLERGNATGSEFTPQFAKACGVNCLWLGLGEGAMLDVNDFTDEEKIIISEFRILKPEDYAYVRRFVTEHAKESTDNDLSNHG